MAEISAALVKELREKTGAGMMDCKSALAAASDMEGAIKILREKGLAKAAKKTSRIAAEGMIAMAFGNNKAAMVEVNCETDFVARNEDFQALVKDLANTALAYQAKNGEDLTNLDGSLLKHANMAQGKSVESVIIDKVATIGEKIDLRRFCVLSDGDLYGSYLHGAGSIGVLVECQLNDANLKTNADVEQAARDLAMHVAAANPSFIEESDIPEIWIKSEREIFRSQVLASGKPENMVDKIVDGKMAKHKKDFCLMDQPFVKNPDVDVKTMLNDVKKSTGAVISVNKIIRFKVGEGLEKKEENFAEEVKKMNG